MSSSTSNFSLPEERLDAELRLAQVERERALLRWLCWVSPLLLFVLIPAISVGLLTVLFLKPLDWSGLQIGRLLSLKVLLSVTALTALPWLWRGVLQLRSNSHSTVPTGLLCSVICVALANFAVGAPQVRWTLLEWFKVRTPSGTFARNTLNWEQRAFENDSNAKHPSRRIALVGSSQMYQSTNLELLAESSHDRWEKQCLAGFGPMQYSWLADRIVERKPAVVVCWLSEFDFYREEAVPTSRLRWSATPQNTLSLWRDLSLYQRWQNRGEFTDLSLAAVLPVWRQRDHFRRTFQSYWWNANRPTDEERGTESVVLAESANLDASIENLRANVRRTAFVNVNFASFARFAETLRTHSVELVVFEGQLHAATHVAYDRAFHQEVDARLQELSVKHGFRYIHGAELMTLTAADFADGYHTNDEGRDKWSRYLVRILNTPR